MSYTKAMKHARNVRKVRKQSRMYFGFHTGYSPPPKTPEILRLEEIRRWFAERHQPHEQGATYVRECIREAIAGLRKLRSERIRNKQPQTPPAVRRIVSANQAATPSDKESPHVNAQSHAEQPDS